MNKWKVLTAMALGVYRHVGDPMGGAKARGGLG